MQERRHARVAALSHSYSGGYSIGSAGLEVRRDDRVSLSGHMARDDDWNDGLLVTQRVRGFVLWNDPRAKVSEVLDHGA